MRKMKFPGALPSLVVSTVMFFAWSSLIACSVNGSKSGLDSLVSNPFLLMISVPVFIGLWAILNGLFEKRKSARRLILLVFTLAVIVPSVFATSLSVGLFDYVSLAEGSMLDLNHCTALLKLRNSGLSNVEIRTIQIDNITYDVSTQYGRPRSYSLKRGETATLAIYFARNGFMWGGSLESGYFDPMIQFDSDVDIAPTTFVEGEHPVRIHTEGLMDFESKINTAYSSNEEVKSIQGKIFNLNEQRIGNQSFCQPDMTITLDMPEGSVAFIYSVTLGNLTLTFSPKLMITWLRDISYLTLWGLSYLEYPSGPYGSAIQVIPNQPVSPTLFNVGQTYNLTVRTLTNRNYTIPVTMTK